MKRSCGMLLVLALTVLTTVGVLTADCFAFKNDAEGAVQDERCLSFDASVSADGDCIEVIMSSSQAACGVLATLSYDPEYFSFLTFAKSETLSENVNISCSDLGGRVRVLVDGDENFDGGVWCRFFFSINELTITESKMTELFFEISASVDSAYVFSESGYSELYLEGKSVRLDLHEYLNREHIAVENHGAASMEWIDFGSILEEYCAVCISGYADRKDFAAGFEVTVSCENLTESYTVSRVLPVAADDKRKYTVIMLLPARNSFYVTVRVIGYSGRDAVREEDIYCFFVSGSGIERVGFD